jgi:hypothetical protein
LLNLPLQYRGCLTGFDMTSNIKLEIDGRLEKPGIVGFSSDQPNLQDQRSYSFTDFENSTTITQSIPSNQDNNYLNCFYNKVGNYLRS